VVDVELVPTPLRPSGPVTVGTSRAVSVRDHAQQPGVVRVDNRMQRRMAALRGAAYLAAQATEDRAALAGMGEMLEDRFANFALNLRDQHVDEETWGLPGEDADAVLSRWTIANARAKRAVQDLNDDLALIRSRYVDSASALVAEALDAADTRHPLLRFLDPDGDVFPER
jgi:hypothetical protein